MKRVRDYGISNGWELKVTRRGEIFTTISIKAKKGLVIKRYCIPEEYIFSGFDLAFIRGIKRVLLSRGIDGGLKLTIRREAW